MVPGLYRSLAASVLSLHAAYIAWVILGAFFTRGRPRLAVLHVATLVYSVISAAFMSSSEWFDGTATHPR
jgi:Protein of Unknown function (DUF2784).